MTPWEFWKEQYDTVVADKKQLGEKLRETISENKDLQEQLDRLKNSLTYDYLKSMDMENGRLKESLEGANKFSDSLQEKLDAADAEKKALQTRHNNLKATNEAIRSMNSAISRRLSSSMNQAQELKIQIDAMTEENTSLHNVIDSFVDKCKELEAKVEGYENALKDGKERLDKSIADRSELQADRDIWFRKNGEKLAEIEELKKKIQSLEADIEFKALCRDGWRDRAEKAERQLEEKKQQSYADGYSDGNEEGQNELWEMLQMVKDMQPNEFDSECECLGDVIDMDLEDFKEAYGKWEAEQKKSAEEAKKQHVDYMRGYLKRYCVGKLCFDCPLYSTVSSCLFSKLTDEEVEKRYRKVVDSEWEKAPRYFRSTIETVFTAEAKINKDLLKDICGIKPKEEEHKFEYGDAVRLPWRDYDYMYIGPDEKEETLVHLFDPENHAIVTTHISNVRYNGGRILVAEEDDIRKIWKYMK